MSERSAVIGSFPDGTMRLRTSLIGFDAFTGPDAGMSFDSEWTDILKIHAIGIAALRDSSLGYIDNIYFPDLGYKPFVELRKLAGNIVYDDYVTDTSYGVGVTIYSSYLRTVASSSAGGLPGGGTVLFAIYPVPVPAP